jgi:hypothetical protein
MQAEESLLSPRLKIMRTPVAGWVVSKMGLTSRSSRRKMPSRSARPPSGDAFLPTAPSIPNANIGPSPITHP